MQTRLVRTKSHRYRCVRGDNLDVCVFRGWLLCAALCSLSHVKGRSIAFQLMGGPWCEECQNRDGEKKKDVFAPFHYPQHTNTLISLLLFLRVEGSLERERRLENDWRMPVILCLSIFLVNKCNDHLLWTKYKYQALRQQRAERNRTDITELAAK